MVQEVAGTLSTFGQQALSTKPSSARTKIGTSLRVELVAEKPFVDKLLGTASPGPSTRVQSGFGVQQSSKSETASSYKIGTRLNDIGGSRTPGPGHYATAQDAVGKQHLSMHATSPTTRVGTAERFSRMRDDYITPLGGTNLPSSLGGNSYTFHGSSKRTDVALGSPGNRPTRVDSPGAGAYNTASALGPQSDSLRVSSPRTRVGTSDREHALKVYVSKGHEREKLGTHSPSPHVYSPKVAASSKVRASSAWGFGSGDRFSQSRPQSPERARLASRGVPGPGSYVV